MSVVGSGYGLSGVGERLLPQRPGTSYRPVRLHYGLTADLLRGGTDILSRREFLDEFVSECPGAAAWPGTVAWVRDTVAQEDIPIVASVRRGESLLALAFGVEHTVRGRASWLASCGNLTGQLGLFVTSSETSENRDKILRAAGDAMMRTGLAALLISCKQAPNDVELPLEGAGTCSVVGARVRRDVYDTFDLGRSMDESLAKLGAHTRRNLRYYRRRAMRELKCEFLPEMASQTMRSAIVELQFVTDDRIRPGVAKNRIAHVMRKPEAFCMGLRTADGRWLSWLTGWRVGTETYVDWQCNRGAMPRYSLSTVMRSYLIEHEGELGQTQLRFLGGTPHTMHYGFREEICVDWLLLRRGPWTLLLQPVGWVLKRVWALRKRREETASIAGGTRRAVRVGKAMHLLKRMAGVLMVR